MKRSDLADLIAAEHGLTKSQAEKVVQTLLDGILTAIRKGSKVTLSGFGHFEARDRAARDARNPQTGNLVAIKAHKALVFRPAKAVRDALKAHGGEPPLMEPPASPA